MRLVSLKFFFTAVLLAGFMASAQFTVPQKPAVLYPVYDEAGLLSAEEKNLLNEKLISFADSTSTEIEVIIIPTTGGEDINFVAWQFGETWKIGKKGQDNGIVFLIASEDRKISIQQGRDVEKYLTASVAGQIIDYIIAPNFKQGQWYEGINRGTTALMEAVQGKYKPRAKEPSEGGGMSVFEILLIAFFIIFLLSFFFGSKGGGKGGRGDDDDDVILSRRGRRTYPGGFFPFPPMGGGFGGGGGSFGGGGGFGGFGGGGSFGGGGASGGW